MRKAGIKRKTRETDIKLALAIDGSGKHSVKTTVPFLDHMLCLFSRHGLMDLRLSASGDTEVDDHHTVEDVGIVLGKAFREALGDMKGIRRYGDASVPMDEALAVVSADISGRAYLVFNVCYPKRSKIKSFDVDLVVDFLQAFVSSAGVTLHVNVPYGRNTHHMLEGVFKALGVALRKASEKDPRAKGLPSTKGTL